MWGCRAQKKARLEAELLVFSLVGDNYSKESGSSLALTVPRKKRREDMMRDRKVPTVILHNKLLLDSVAYGIYSHAPGSSVCLGIDTYRLFSDLG